MSRPTGVSRWVVTISTPAALEPVGVIVVEMEVAVAQPAQVSRPAGRAATGSALTVF
jgi:hypothetical protein